jgi:hypothetical protein
MVVVAKQAVAGRAGSVAGKGSVQVCQDWSADDCFSTIYSVLRVCSVVGTQGVAEEPHNPSCDGDRGGKVRGTLYLGTG